MSSDAQVVVATERFGEDLTALTEELGFRVDVIHPADSPSIAVVSGHGLRLRLERAALSRPVTIELVTDEAGEPRTLPGGSTIGYRRRTTTYELTENRPSLSITRADRDAGVGRAGMHYRDLIPDRWGGRFVSSHITIPEGGPVPDYVHFHKIRFQMIFVKSGWVRLVYEDQGEPFVMHTGDCVLQPPEIRHRVLESSTGLEVIEIGCPAEHETIADWSLDLPTGHVTPERNFGGQTFVRHIAAEATYDPWRLAGWEYRDTGIGAATVGLAGARVARPTRTVSAEPAFVAHDTEFCQFVVLAGSVVFDREGGDATRLSAGDSAAVPGNTSYRLAGATDDCEVLDVTLPAEFDLVATDS